MDLPRTLPNRRLQLEGIETGLSAPSESCFRDQKGCKERSGSRGRGRDPSDGKALACTGIHRHFQRCPGIGHQQSAGCVDTDDLVSTLRSCWSDPNPGRYFHGGTACLSCLLEAGQYQELLELLELDRHPMWHYRRYPMKDKSQILADLIATTPGEEGKWFATAKEIKLFDLALELANRSHCDPKTLTRAARDYLDAEPAFALGSALAALRWLSEGWGYEVTSADVVEAYDRAIDAASRLNKIDEVTGQIQQLVESKESASMQFVRQALHGRMRAHSSSVNEMVARERI